MKAALLLLLSTPGSSDMTPEMRNVPVLVNNNLVLEGIWL